MDMEAHVQALGSPPTPTLEDTFDKLGKHFSLVGPSLFGAGAEARWGGGAGPAPTWQGGGVGRSKSREAAPWFARSLARRFSRLAAEGDSEL